MVVPLFEEGGCQLRLTLVFPADAFTARGLLGTPIGVTVVTAPLPVPASVTALILINVATPAVRDVRVN